MEEKKIPSKNLNTMEKNCNVHKEEVKLTEKCRPAPLKKEIAYDVELKDSVQSITAKKEVDSDRQELVKKNKNRVLKRKVTEDGVTIERVLSEGEASSGFETVSSISSELDLEDFHDESDYNVIVRIENELAYQQSKNSGQRRHCPSDRSNGEIRYNSESERVLCNYSGQRHGIVRSYKQSLHWRRLYNGSFQRYDWTDSWARADEDSRYSRRTSCDGEWSRFSDYSIRSREGRCIDQNKRYRGSLYTEDIMGKSKKKKKRTSIHRENSETKYELIGSKSLSYEIIKRESKHYKNFDSSKSSTKRLLQSTKQSISSSPKSSSMSIWKRLDGGGPHKKSKKDEDRSSRSPSANKPRKKERTPFLVELERKLKKAKLEATVNMADLAKSDQTKSQNCVTVTAPEPAAVTIPAAATMNEAAAPMNEAVAPMNEAVAPMDGVAAPMDGVAAPMDGAAAGSLNPNYAQTSNYAYTANNPQLYSTHYVSFPTLSLENLPLMPGPTGLPVHVTATGEQIFYDMDGRRIPIGPNGHYLPLDPTGRLFAHIVSPGNQAVPIHMTEDGVLRLPNSEPVPCGPSHNLPVDIDGRIIYIGPDSRPLGHYPNLPRQPPLHLIQMTQYNAFGNGQTEIQEGTSAIPQVCQAGSAQTSEIGGARRPEVGGGLEGPNSNPSSMESPISNQSVNQSSSVQSIGSYLLSSIPNSWDKTNRADVLMNYQKRALKRQDNVLKCIEIEKNLGVSPSKGGVKRSTPMKLSQKRISKDENDGDCYSTDSTDSETASGLNSSSAAKKDKKHFVDSNPEDLLVIKIRQVLKSLSESKFNPPALGRFLISEVLVDGIRETSPNESPLMKNRVKLPFITPNGSTCPTPKPESETVGKSAVIFSFLSREKSSDWREKEGQPRKKYIKNCDPVKLPVFTFDSAVQCDLTLGEISKLNTKIVEMEKEVVRLRNVNANLLDGFRNVQKANEKKKDELARAFSDIEKRNGEILILKRLLNEERRG